jgi:hypothetical protein
MNTPSFTAEASLYKASGHYRTTSGLINPPTSAISAVEAAVIEIWDEVINIHGHPPPPPDVDPHPWENLPTPQPPFPNPPGPTPPGGGGGGGGMGSEMSTFNMDVACFTAGWGCTLASSVTVHCAVFKCESDYCKDHECTAAERKKASNAEGLYQNSACDLHPCKKAE